MAEIKSFAVVGSGAIGSYYGAMLARTGEQVHFLMRSDLETVREQGIRIETLDETFSLKPSQFEVAATTEAIGPVDCVLIGLKATANEVVPELVKPLIGPNTRLCTLQNGMGNVELLAEHFGPERVIGGLCFICLNRTAPGVIHNSNRGRLTLSAHHPEARAATEQLAQQFKAAQVQTDVLDSLDEALWRKLVWNIPFNGLSIAAGGVTTDVICGDEHLLDLTWKLMRETQAAAKAQGHQISDSFLQKQVDRTAPMGPYKPSSLVDFVENRAVEVEAIWGEPLRRAQAAGVKTPFLESLYRLLKAQVEHRGKGLKTAF